MSSFKILLGCLLLFTCSSATCQLSDGETVVFLGDSITQQGAGPDGYVTLVRKAIDANRPDSGIKVVGAGIGGHKVPDLEKRLDRDVLAHKPDVVVIYIGINDVWHSTRGQGTEIGRYESGLTSLLERCTAAGARVILATPSVIGEKHDGTNEMDAMLEDFSAVSRKVTEASGATLLDLRQAFVSHLAHYNIANQDKGILTGDGVHLSGEGNRFVAARMLESLGEVSTRQRLLRHHVYFKFEEAVTSAQIDEINRAFANLKNQIPTIVDFECGVNNSPEKLNDGFTHAYTVSFTNEEGRDAYLPHPAHKKFVKLVGGKLAGVFVVDYWVVE
jgi:lysophospholipase L1-like esterase